MDITNNTSIGTFSPPLQSQNEKKEPLASKTLDRPNGPSIQSRKVRLDPLTTLFNKLSQKDSNGHTPLSLAIQQNDTQALLQLQRPYADLTNKAKNFNPGCDARFSSLVQYHVYGPLPIQSHTYANCLHHAMVAQASNNNQDYPNVLTCTLEIYEVLGLDVLESALTEIKNTEFQVDSFVDSIFISFLTTRDLNLNIKDIAFDLCPEYKIGQGEGLDRGDLFMNIMQTPPNKQPLKRARK